MGFIRQDINVMNKIIIGRVGERTIIETIQQYQPGIGELIATAKKNICRKFEREGYSPNDVIFDDL